MGLNQYLGQIIIFAGNFEPNGWAFCDGRLMSIAQNTALFSLLGTQYGGNGTSNFALPDLRGRVPIDAGQGPGPTAYVQGDSGGVETVALDASTTPAHAHQVNALHGPTSGTSAVPAVQQWAYSAQQAYAPTGNVKLAPDAIAAAGAGQPHDNMSPYVSINFIIALQGIFPARN